MSRVLGELIQEGCIGKIANNMFCGGDTPDDALHVWIRVLQALDLNNLGLCASKTVVCPKSTTVLGWTWSLGSITVSPHKLSALQIIKTIDAPPTVQGLLLVHRCL